MNQYERFGNLRDRLFKCIAEYMKDSYGHKNYEGQLDLEMPSYFDQDNENAWTLTLDLYCIGPNRHYTFEHKTLEGLNERFEWFVKAREKEMRKELFYGKEEIR